ncbi:sulfatase-like hydrolase/transferase [Halosimplex rubrum]|uniref:Sulfatase-like hydrolase/transferase n=1 Tax=Halosimplex rubrum TaxID=869889 RepID=A0A7D5SZ34_9EURY|nr:sulfatase-like hydrolase/transferase [Halosimplex rubrum]QLH78451.1 sulfatase-like hydrolase/transferase [Halosimplex rubrum]
MPDQPNVLWICTDQQRADTLGCYGNDFVETPNIDELASSGVRFDRAYAQSPVCTPSRASFLTGRYPRTTGVRGNGYPIPESETLVTRRLADEGYVCGLSGKLHVNPAHPDSDDLPMGERRIDDGYADFQWSHGTTHPSPVNEYQRWLLEEGVEYEERPVGDCEHVTVGMPPEHHQTTWCARKAESFIERAAEDDEPWLYSVNPFDPHHAFVAPDGYLQRYLDRLDEIPLPDYEPGELDDKPPWYRECHEGAYANENLFPFEEMDERDHRLVIAAYWAMCDLIDDAVGRLLDALERTGQREDTLVIFTSDHGELLGEHGIYLKGAFFYEESLRVPLIVSGPEIESGVETDALVELVDLAPTLMEAAGQEVPRAMQGESLWPLLTGETDADTHRESVYAEAYDTVHWQAPTDYSTMVRTNDHKLVRHHRAETGELYDLAADPAERENRWDDPDYADVRSDLLARLADRMAETADPLPERRTPW